MVHQQFLEKEAPRRMKTEGSPVIYNLKKRGVVSRLLIVQKPSIMLKNLRVLNRRRRRKKREFNCKFGQQFVYLLYFYSILRFTLRFNKNPSKGIKFLQSEGLLGETATEVAQFLHTDDTLDKVMIILVHLYPLQSFCLWYTRQGDDHFTPFISLAIV